MPDLVESTLTQCRCTSFCPPGWLHILRAVLLVAPKGIVFAQIKEKFGGLRIYVDSFAEDTPEEEKDSYQRQLRFAEFFSRITCQDCAKPADVDYETKPGRYIRTLCEDCRKKRDTN